MKKLIVSLLALTMSAFGASVSSITCSGQTATVNATAHGTGGKSRILAVGDLSRLQLYGFDRDGERLDVRASRGNSLL
jgi:hypothetical protein